MDTVVKSMDTGQDALRETGKTNQRSQERF